MRTNHVNILLPDYARGMLGRDDIATVEEHLQSCPACQAELSEVRDAFAAIEQAPGQVLPKGFWSSILPRVHQRIDERTHFDWSRNQLLKKIVLPTGAAIVVAALLWLAPFGNNGGISENALQAAVDSATSEDLAEIIQSDIPSQDLSAFNDMILSRALTNDLYVRRKIVQEALASENTSSFSDFSETSPQQLLDGFDETQTDELLQRLGHRETL